MSMKENSNEKASINASTHPPKFGIIIANRIFVGGIPPQTLETELFKYFSDYGLVKDVKIIVDRAGVSKGYGFVTFESEDDVKKVQQIAELLIFKERKLNVGPAIKKQPNSKLHTLSEYSNQVTHNNPSMGALFYPPGLGISQIYINPNNGNVINGLNSPLISPSSFSSGFLFSPGPSINNSSNNLGNTNGLNQHNLSPLSHQVNVPILYSAQPFYYPSFPVPNANPCASPISPPQPSFPAQARWINNQITGMISPGAIIYSNPEIIYQPNVIPLSNSVNHNISPHNSIQQSSPPIITMSTQFNQPAHSNLYSLINNNSTNAPTHYKDLEKVQYMNHLASNNPDMLISHLNGGVPYINHDVNNSNDFMTQSFGDGKNKICE
ncbi:deleted in azoospermia protein 4-like isoform X2 [Gordionus sp. m RMFG-2023]|uniref:deleted in azoospermia protein 4-like isoform X2 n=1 Tax=Gordionus sp. m RMFG-2023 TaxID=3053472 RepID=UPI0031FDCCBB